MNKTLGNIFKGDKVVWMVFFFLCIISVLEVFSSSSSLSYKGGNYWSPAIKHSGLLFFGLFCMIVALNIKCKYYKIATPFMYAISLLLLLLVLAMGSATNDAHRWFSLFGLQFQPSEIAKGTVVLLCAQILSSTQTPEGADKRAFWWIMGACAPIILLIGVENLSTAALICATIFMMMFIGRVPLRQLGGLMGVGTMLIGFVIALVMLLGKTQTAPPPSETEAVVQATSEGGSADEANTIVMGEETSGVTSNTGILHRFDTWKARIMKFLDNKEVAPEDVDLDKDAQVVFSKVAIATSGIIGCGPGNSEQRDFLSQAFSDFIYAIVIEELGLAGAFVVAFLYVVLLFRAGRIANRCENNFPAFLAMGLALMLVVQALFNMCVAVGIVPVTGQPLPLISKGGTSTIINCVYIGIILSISRSAKKKVVETAPSKA